MARGLDPDLAALQEVRDCVARAQAALEAVRGYDQAGVDRLCRAMSEAGARAAYDLARLAVEETGIGRVHYKILKNLFGTEGVWKDIANEKTVGVIKRDASGRALEIATPSGVIAGIVPTTNPTSTALGKSLMAVKGRNAIVISPHPRAKRCIGESAEVMRRAIERAGGPPDLVQSLSNPTIESTGGLMKHKGVSLILATGGSGLVRAAYSSGKPAYGVGPGNVPVYVDRSADVKDVAHWVIASQSFDNATLCCSEQALVLDEPIADAVLAEFQRRGAHLCSEEEREKLIRYANRNGMMNPDIVGIDPWRIADGAGFSVPRQTTVLLANEYGVGPEFPLSIEILAPVLSVHRVDGWKEGCATSKALLHFGGLGHTVGVWARDEGVLEAWFLEKPGSRIIANGPTAQGGVGYSSGLVPSMSLGCGPLAGNITSDNVTARHLITIKRVGWMQSDWVAQDERDHALAASLGGEESPRGSGLQGDPALGGGPARGSTSAFDTPHASSNWSGNPATVLPAAAAPRPAASPRQSMPAPARSVVRPRTIASGSAATQAAPIVSKVQAAAKVRPPVGAPTFTRPGGVPSASDVRPASGSGAAAPSHAKSGPTHVGDSLSPDEIQNMMSHAGAGCPLGPCQGCAHKDVQTGACKA